MVLRALVGCLLIGAFSNALAAERATLRRPEKFSPAVQKAVEKDIKLANDHFAQVYRDQSSLEKMVPKSLTLVNAAAQKTWAHPSVKAALKALPPIDVRVVMAWRDAELPTTGYAGSTIHVLAEDLRVIKTIDELAFIIIHETAHHSLGHLFLKHQKETANGEVSESFFQELEIEADQMATYILADVGLNPRAGLTVLENAAEYIGDRISARHKSLMLSLAKERRASLEAFIKKESFADVKSSGETDVQAMQAELKQIFR